MKNSLNPARKLFKPGDTTFYWITDKSLVRKKEHGKSNYTLSTDGPHPVVTETHCGESRTLTYFKEDHTLGITYHDPTEPIRNFQNKSCLITFDHRRHPFIFLWENEIQAVLSITKPQIKRLVVQERLDQLLNSH
jgi:hypothetical protein